MIYAAAGITTAQEGATNLEQLEVLQRGAARAALFLDVVALPLITELDRILAEEPARLVRDVPRPAEAGRREDRPRRVAAGEDRVLHHALSDRRSDRPGGLAGRAVVPARGPERDGQAVLRPEAPDVPPRQRRRGDRHAPEGARTGVGRRPRRRPPDRRRSTRSSSAPTSSTVMSPTGSSRRSSPGTRTTSARRTWPTGAGPRRPS